jgi:hypothetical protein
LVMLPSRHSHSWPGLVMPPSRHSQFRLGLVMLLSQHSQFRLGLVMRPVVAYPFSARIGYAPVVEGSSSVRSVLSQREKVGRISAAIMRQVAKSHTAGIPQHGAGHR